MSSRFDLPPGQQPRTGRRLVLPLSFGAMLALGTASEAQAQISVSMHENVPDSIAWIVPRQQYDVANAKVRSRDRNVTLLLTDTTLVLQLSQRGMDHIDEKMRDASDGGFTTKVLTRMLGAGVAQLLDHGIAYRLSALREARSERGRLVLEDRDGHHVFENVEINGTHLLEDLSPADAQRFADDVNRAIRRLR